RTGSWARGRRWSAAAVAVARHSHEPLVGSRRNFRTRSTRREPQSRRRSARIINFMRVLGVDYGSARCGCAVSDPTGVLVTPLEPVLAPGTRRGLAALRKLVGELG